MTAYRTAARTDAGRVRKINEDAVLCRPEAGLWAVADGMGGHAFGDWASQQVIQALSAPQAADSDGLAGEVRKRMMEANAALVARGQSQTPPRTVGSTVVALLLDGSRFACLWAGDSRGYRLRKGVLKQLTRDHTLVQQLADRGLIAQEDVAGHPDGHVVTRAIGASAGAELDAAHGDLRDGDVFLLCSDGLSRLLSEEELASGLANEDVEEAAGFMMAQALERGAPDNVSLVIVRFDKH